VGAALEVSAAQKSKFIFAIPGCPPRRCRAIRAENVSETLHSQLRTCSFADQWYLDRPKLVFDRSISNLSGYPHDLLLLQVSDHDPLDITELEIVQSLTLVGKRLVWLFGAGTPTSTLTSLGLPGAKPALVPTAAASVKFQTDDWCNLLEQERSFPFCFRGEHAAIPLAWIDSEDVFFAGASGNLTSNSEFFLPMSGQLSVNRAREIEIAVNRTPRPTRAAVTKQAPWFYAPILFATIALLIVTCACALRYTQRSEYAQLRRISAGSQPESNAHFEHIEQTILEADRLWSNDLRVDNFAEEDLADLISLSDTFQAYDVERAVVKRLLALPERSGSVGISRYLDVLQERTQASLHRGESELATYFAQEFVNLVDKYPDVTDAPLQSQELNDFRRIVKVFGGRYELGHKKQLTSMGDCFRPRRLHKGCDVEMSDDRWRAVAPDILDYYRVARSDAPKAIWTDYISSHPKSPLREEAHFNAITASFNEVMSPEVRGLSSANNFDADAMAFERAFPGSPFGDDCATYRIQVGIKFGHVGMVFQGMRDLLTKYSLSDRTAYFKSRLDPHGDAVNIHMLSVLLGMPADTVIARAKDVLKQRMSQQELIEALRELDWMTKDGSSHKSAIPIPRGTIAEVVIAAATSIYGDNVDYD